MAWAEAMLFDVVQVSLRNYIAGDGRGLYLEIYIVGEKASRKRRLRSILPCKKKREKQRFAECRRSTQVAREESEVFWRGYDENGFSKALFSMGGESLRLRRGARILLGADIFRCPLGGKGGAEVGLQPPADAVGVTKVHTLRGYVENTHSPVTLVLEHLLYAKARRKGGENDPEDDDKLEVTLDICRARTAPFRLDHARPRLEMPKVIPRTRSESQFFEGVNMLANSDSSGQRSDSRMDAIGSKRWLAAAAAPLQILKFSERSMSGLASDRSYPSRPPRPSTGSGSGGLLSKWQQSISSGGLADMLPVASTDEAGGDGAGGAANSAGGAGSGPSSFWRFHTSRTTSLGSDGLEKAQREPVQNQMRRDRRRQEEMTLKGPFILQRCRDPYNHRTPKEWMALWKGPWPVDAEDLGDRDHEVHQLMEAEFRKDCLVFYNTLFPRVKGEGFMMLKAAALNPNSGVSFKVLLRPMRQGSMGSIFNLGARRYSFVGGVKNSPVEVERIASNQPGTPAFLSRAMSNDNNSFSGTVGTQNNGSTSQDVSGCQSAVLASSDEAAASPDPEPDLEGIRLAEEEADLDVAEETVAQEIPETREKAEDNHLCELATMQLVAPPPEAPEAEVRNSGFGNDLGIDHAWSMGSHPTSEKGESEQEDRSSMAMLSEPLVGASVTASRAGQRWQRDNKFYESKNNSNKGPQGSRLRTRRPSLMSAGSLFAPGGLMTSLNSTDPSLYITPKLVTPDRTQFADEYGPRIMFLKRLMLAFATCGVYYREDGHNTKSLWPYPIASILGHGSRVLIRLEDVSTTEFLNFLLAGVPDIFDWYEYGMPQPFFRRMAATHAVTMEAGELVEKKLEVTNVVSSLQNLADGALGRHLGLNLSVGGGGNPSPLGKGMMVGFTGDVMQQQTERLLSAMEKVGKKMEKVIGKAFFSDAEEADTNSTDVTEMLGLNDVSSKGLGNFTEKAMKAKAAIRRRQRWRRARQRFSEWRAVPNVQGGHMYVRVDDHSELWLTQEEHLAGNPMEEAKKEVRMIFPSKLVLENTEIRRRHKVQIHKSAAGLLFMGGEPHDEFEQHRQKMQFPVDSGYACTWSHHGPVPLARMMSDPCLPTYLEDDMAVPQAELPGVTESTEVDAAAQLKWKAHIQDMNYIKMTIVQASQGIIKEPKSANALRLLLEYYHPASVRRFGKGRFRTVADLYTELLNKRCFLVKQGAGLIRLVEPMFIRLRFDSYVLLQRLAMQEGDNEEDATQMLQLPSTRLETVVIVGQAELWRIVLEDWAQRSLPLPSTTFMESLVDLNDESDKHRIIQERGHSLDYPGLDCLCRTHLVNVQIKRDYVRHYRDSGFKMPGVDGHDENLSFTLQDPVSEEVSFWQWVHEDEVDWPKVSETKIPPGFSDDSWLRTAENDSHYAPWRSARSHPSSEVVTGADESRTLAALSSASPSASNPLGFTIGGGGMIKSDSQRNLQSSGSNLTNHGNGNGSKEKLESSMHDISCAHSPTASTPTSPKNSRKLGRLTGSAREKVSGLSRRRGSLASSAMNDPNRRRTAISSILLGLEGSMPGKQSPFNTKHDTSGKSSAISVVGSRKWRAYKMNSALQVPSEIGGISMRISQAMFQELQETCAKLDLVDATEDVILGRDEGFSREMHERRFLEKELFRNILAGNGEEARAAVDWMLDYRASHPTMEQARQAVVGPDDQETREKLRQLGRQVRP